MTAIPDAQDRGAYMSVNSATMQISGGIASVIAGLIVSQSPTGMIEHYDILGYVVSGLMGVMIVMMYFINKSVEAKQGAAVAPAISSAIEENATPEFATDAI
jgi:predicted MFS family arabinose efflux permease